MKIFIFLVIFVVTNIQDVRSGDSGFVTLWTPKFVQEDAPYRFFILPTDVRQKTEVAVQFRKSSAAFMMTNGQLGTVEYPSKQRQFGKQKSMDLTMTLYRNMSSGEMRCSTRSATVEAQTGNFYNFIQTDKPIYKPGDLVQFRILTVDKDLKPFHRNTIVVNITDPFDRTMQYFQDQEGKFSGVFDGNITLSPQTILGDWKITVIVDNKTHMATSKIFAVQKYKLPLFDVHIDIPEPHVLKNDNITLSIYAKYSFEEYVSGKAELIIRGAVNRRVYLRTVLNDIKSPTVTKWDLSKLGVATTDEMELEAYVEFTESESGIKFSKTANFYAHHYAQYKFKVVHGEKFLPGFPFTTKVFVYNWKGEKIMKHFEKIQLFHLVKRKDGSTKKMESLGKIEDGIYVSEYQVPNDLATLSIEVEFLRKKVYKKDIPLGSVNIGIKSLVVDHSPKNPKFRDKVKVFVTSETELKNILMAVVTRYGNVEQRQISCNGQKLCEFEVAVVKEMMPHSTVIVYDVKDSQNIFQGQTKIVTEEVGVNTLELELPTKMAKTKEKIKMKFKTLARSKIYLLAFDRRLRSLRDGNDITKDDVRNEVDFDGENEFVTDDLSSWNACTPEEIERLHKGRQYISRHSKSKVSAKEAEENSNENWEEGGDKPKPDETPDDLLREYFPETWIFETIQAGSKEFEKTFKVPDSMTTWLVSAFSVHKTGGLAIAPTQELTVKNDFFVKMDLPYSIRYNEVIKLNVLVFNYVKTDEELNVQLKLFNINGKEFEFVEVNNDCKISSTIESNEVASTNVKVPPNEVRKASFFIRTHSTNNKFNPKIISQIRIRAEAKATDTKGNSYLDRLEKRLTVEPVGLKEYSFDSYFHKLNNEKIGPIMTKTNYSEDLSSINVIVTGDFLSDAVNVDNPFEKQALFLQFPGGCLEQKTSRLKQYVEAQRYLALKAEEKPQYILSHLYQSVLSALKSDYAYKDHPWYRAYLGDVLATAMKSGVLPKDIKVVYESLDMMAKGQVSNGTFSNFKFYYGLPGNEKSDEYKDTRKYFAAAYTLIPFLKHRDFLGTRYDNLILRGLRFLGSSENQVKVHRNALGVAAHAFALNGDRAKVMELLELIEIGKFVRDGKVCYMLFDTDNDCDVRLTTSVAMALVTIKDMTNAMPVISWLMEKKIFEYYSPGRYSVITEPIVEMAIYLSTNDTLLDVKIRDEHSFATSLTVANYNKQKSQNIEMPPHSDDVIYEVSGTGYCTISMVFERTVFASQLTPTFKITTALPHVPTDIIGFPHSRLFEASITICATYTPTDNMKPVLVNVIYEIEMPSGYTFVEIKDSKQHREIKQIDTKKDGTLVYLYYGDYMANKNYCVDVLARSEFLVLDASNAGIKVYDYDDKENIAVEFYRFDTSYKC